MGTPLPKLLRRKDNKLGHPGVSAGIGVGQARPIRHAWGDVVKGTEEDLRVSIAEEDGLMAGILH